MEHTKCTGFFSSTHGSFYEAIDACNKCEDCGCVDNLDCEFMESGEWKCYWGLEMNSEVPNYCAWVRFNHIP